MNDQDIERSLNFSAKIGKIPMNFADFIEHQCKFQFLYREKIMENKTKQFKIWIITALILLFESIPCSVVSQEITDTKNFTNLVVFTKFSDEEEFINNTYAGTTVRNILENTYNKSM